MNHYSDTNQDALELLKAIEKTDLKKTLWVKCSTKEHLRLWLKTYLDLTLPVHALTVLWQVYEAMLRNLQSEDAFYNMGRCSHKTTVCSILGILALLHFGRNAIYVGATEMQARMCGRYVQRHLSQP